MSRFLSHVDGVSEHPGSRADGIQPLGHREAVLAGGTG